MEPRYWILDFDPTDHRSDAVDSLDNGTVTCLVDEEAGGIIAYVLNPKDADTIASLLNEEHIVKD